MSIPNLLSIAGSDPSGGAGIQADLKTFTAHGCFGTTVVTALTAQNTRGVTGVLPTEAGFVADQLATLLDDVRIDAVKIGMLGSVEVARGE
ncbi:bifunctional hydroxymethylpyrimidine kinase/phosphomethylpyrimidine kinase [Luteococcus peritonei]|uniref:Hydroxymethylpyrimidine/phosphomethylpyrimidine kinase n=1 Tax=Luteococcus peritonei TaxID=88874 RepID=A0ABW4RZM6_9ACTN